MHGDEGVITKSFALRAATQGLFAASSDGLGRKLAGMMPSSILYFINLMYSAAVLVNLLGCLWYWTARREGIHSDHVWLRSVGEAPSAPSTSLHGSRHFLFCFFRLGCAGDLIQTCAQLASLAPVARVCGELLPCIDTASQYITGRLTNESTQHRR